MLTQRSIFACLLLLLVLHVLPHGFMFSSNVYEINNLHTANKVVLMENAQKLIISLNKALDFINEYYYEMNLDGVLGLVLTEAQLRKALKSSHNGEVKSTLLILIDKCQISRKIKQSLPEELHKHVLFKYFLLNPHVWEDSNGFMTELLENMGIYNSWTVQDILKNRTATYNGITSDECMAEILDQASENMIQLCYVSPGCQTFMFGRRQDTGYVLTHRLLYVYVWRIVGCIMEEEIMAHLITKYCSLILKEVKTNTFLGYPQHDIFLEQVVLCGMEGFTEFFQDDWTKTIIEWQTQEGCYKENKTNIYDSNTIRSRSANVITFGCTDHATGLGAAALAVNLRYTLWRLNL